ncbi:MAG: PorV/PorQ family protein [candidate division Zixibacteria bacterium]
MKLYKWIIFMILVMTSMANAQVSQTAVQFLLIAPGARAGGMGETFVAISDDATAVHWNPAGLGRYPLSGAWLDFNAGSQDTIESVVLIKNSLPEVNYLKYDIWGLVNGKLARWDGERWVTGTYRTLKEGGSLQTLIERYTGLSEEQAGEYVDKIARSNNELAPEVIDSLENELLPAVSSDYIYKEEIEYGFEKLHTAWLRLRINLEGLELMKADIAQALSEDPPSIEILDKIAFGFDRAIASKANRGIWIPYNLILPDEITCISSDNDFVYLGSDQGFFRFEPQKLRWSSYNMETDSLPSNRITAVEKFGTRRMLVGTDKGVVIFTGRVVEQFDSESGAPQGMITSITSSKDKRAWVATENDLYFYDGSSWHNSKKKNLSIGETIDSSIRNFYGVFGEVWRDKLTAEIARFMADNIDSVEAGQEITLPYNLGFKGRITNLSMGPRGNLWIGTTSGIVRLTDEGFKHFGYRVFTIPADGMTLNDIATQFIPDRDQTKIDKLAALIREYNDLGRESLSTGDEVFVYANALGSEISAVEAISEKGALVATSFGMVEYSDGKWSRPQNIELSNRKVMDIHHRDNELWVALPEKVSVYSSAKLNFTFMHSNYLVQLADDLYYDYLSVVYPTDEWGTFGFDVTFLSYGKQERRSEGNVDLGTFYSYDIAFTLSYGTGLMDDLSGGLSLRYINSHLAELGAGAERGKGTGYSLAVDAGVLYEVSRDLTLGATVTNLGPDIAYIDADQADPLPRKLAVGFDYKIINSPFHNLSILGEGDKILVGLGDDLQTEIEEIIPHIGLEYWYSNYVSLRTGYVYDKIGVQKYLTLGASLQVSNYRIDFSYIPSSNEDFNRLGNTMRFSMNAGF